MKAVDVEELVEWTYRRQKAHKVIDHGVGLHALEAHAAGILRAETSCLAAVERYGILGCFVDGGGYTAGAIHDDAEAVHDQVRRMAPTVRILLIKHGEQGSRPDWGGRVRSRFIPIWKDLPKRDSWGQPAPRSFEIVYRNNRPVWCPVRFIDRSPFGTKLRTDYTYWHAGLTALARHFRDHPLSAHQVTGPAAPIEPWGAE